MDQTAEAAEYALGLDLGSASIGWALIALDSSYNPHKLLRAGVRIFEPGVEGSMSEIERGKDQSKAIVRRNARLHRPPASATRRKTTGLVSPASAEGAVAACRRHVRQSVGPAASGSE